MNASKPASLIVNDDKGNLRLEASEFSKNSTILSPNKALTCSTKSENTNPIELVALKKAISDDMQTKIKNVFEYFSTRTIGSRATINDYYMRWDHNMADSELGEWLLCQLVHKIEAIDEEVVCVLCDKNSLFILPRNSLPSSAGESVYMSIKT